MPTTPSPTIEVYIDGSSVGNPGPSGVGVVFMDGNRPTPRRQFSAYVGETTNNVAEYLALIYAFQEALAAGYGSLMVKTDSELLARQISGQYRVRDPQLRVFHDLALHLSRALRSWSIQHVPRERNRLADRLAEQAARGQSRLSSARAGTPRTLRAER